MTKIETKGQAIEEFRTLVRLHGLQWNAQVPKQAYDRLADCNRFLDANDRRRALGLRV